MNVPDLPKPIERYGVSFVLNKEMAPLSWKLAKSACNRIYDDIIRPHRRGGRVVEGAPLLREYTRDGIVGSNPILSAIKQSSIQPCHNNRNGALLSLKA